MRRASLLLSTLALTLLSSCSSEPAIPQAREVDYRRPPDQPEPPEPEAAPVKPKTVKVATGKPVRPPWRGERVRALETHPDARGEVEAARARAERDPQVAAAEAKEERARAAREGVAKRRAIQALDEIERRETAECEAKLAAAKESRTEEHARQRRQAYLDAALRQAGRDDPAVLLPIARRVAARADQRVRACRELREEQVARVASSRRITVASITQGVALSGGRLEYRDDLRRLTEITLILDEAEAEASYARSVAAKLDRDWTLAVESQ